METIPAPFLPLDRNYVLEGSVKDKFSRKNLNSDFTTYDCWRTQYASFYLFKKKMGEHAGSGMRSSALVLLILQCPFLLFPGLLRNIISIMLLSFLLTLLLFSFCFISFLFFLVAPFSQLLSIYSFFLSPQIKVPKYFFPWICSGRWDRCNKLWKRRREL